MPTICEPVRLPTLELFEGVAVVGLGVLTYHNVDSKTTGKHKPREFKADSQVQRGLARMFIAIRKRDWRVISYSRNSTSLVLAKSKTT